MNHSESNQNKIFFWVVQIGKWKDISVSLVWVQILELFIYLVIRTHQNFFEIQNLQERIVQITGAKLGHHDRDDVI